MDTPPTQLYIVIAVLIAAQLITTALAAWLWARVTAMPTHQDLDGLRVDIRATAAQVGQLATTVAGLDATAEQTLSSVRVIQSFLMEHKR